jgi:carbon-monoxide dehydrogenase catalytic subunit
MGPCRLPLPKDIEGEDERKGLCGATANTIAARNFIRMIAGGAAAHSDHGRSVAEVFMSAARKETEATKSKIPKLLAIAPIWRGDHGGSRRRNVKDRDMDEIALEVAEKALNEWGKAEGELRIPEAGARQPLYEKMEKTGRPAAQHRPGNRRNHAPHPHGRGPGLQKPDETGHPGFHLADGWGGSMLATDLQDILFGTPYPLVVRGQPGRHEGRHVNIVIHGHEPVLSEMIVAVAQTKEMIDYAKKGAKGIQLSGICCTANEILQRHGVPLCGTFLQQELAIITGACDAMVVDIQCIMQNLANVAKCFHTKLITTHPIAKMEQDNVVHIEFDEHHALEDAKRIVKMAIDNFTDRGAEVMIPKQKSPRWPASASNPSSTTWAAPSAAILHPQRQHHQRPHPRHRRRGGLQQRPHPPQRSPHRRWSRN